MNDSNFECYKRYTELRDTKEINDYKVSKALGVSQQLFSNWKKRGGLLSASNMQNLADFFGVSVSYLTTGKESDYDNSNFLKNIPNDEYYINKKTAVIAQDIYDNDDLRLLFDAARDASPEDLNVVYQMLLALKAKENK